MKKIILPFLLLFILIFTACQEKINVEKEKLAIITVLNEESQAYLDSDYELWASYWVQDESVRRITGGQYGYDFTLWEEFSKNMKTFLENDSAWFGTEDLKYEKSDFNIKIFSDCAWTTFYEKFTGKGQGMPFEQETIHLTVLEKMDGQWKIACFAMVDTTSYEVVETAETEETAGN